MPTKKNTTKKDKSCSLSIYLLNVLCSGKEFLEHDNEYDIETAGNLPSSCRFYLKAEKKNTPWWFEYCGVAKSESISQSAVVYCPITRNGENYAFALAFGMGYHDIKDEYVDRYFGMTVAKNAIDSQKISSVDAVSLINKKKSRIQPAESENLGFIGLDYDSNHLMNLVGYPDSNVDDKITMLSGSYSLRVNNRFNAADIEKLLGVLIDLYVKKIPDDKFPELGSVCREIRKNIIDKLDKNIFKLKDGFKDDVSVCWPYIVDPNKSYKYRFIFNKKSSDCFEELSVNHITEFLDQKGLACNEQLLDDLKIEQTEESDPPVKKFAKLRRCLSFECELDSVNYCIYDGEWYSFNKNYVKTLNKFLEAYMISRPSYLPDFIHGASVPASQLQGMAKGWVEDAYNKKCEDVKNRVFLLDKNNVNVGQSKVEVCDLLRFEKKSVKLIHNKLGTNSATLSHLFNQGVVSADSLMNHTDFKKELKGKINKIGNKYGKAYALTQTEEELLENNHFDVIYGIVTKKVHHPKKKAPVDYLPFFSKISLKNAIRRLRSNGIEAHFCFIDDV